MSFRTAEHSAADHTGCLMDVLATHEQEIELARQCSFPVLITAPPDRALAIAGAIADDDDIVVWDVDAFSDRRQAALMRLLETESSDRRRRVIATSSTSLLDLVKNGSFLESLFYRLNIIHIVSGSCTAGRGTRSRPIIAA